MIHIHAQIDTFLSIGFAGGKNRRAQPRTGGPKIKGWISPPFSIIQISEHLTDEPWNEPGYW